MTEWYFELIYFNSKRMHIDIADGVITTTIAVKSTTSNKALKSAEKRAKKDHLTKQGWIVRVTPCDKSHADTLKRLQNGDSY